MTPARLAAIVAASAEAATDVHGSDLPDAERDRLRAVADLAAQYVAEAVRPSLIEPPAVLSCWTREPPAESEVTFSRHGADPQTFSAARYPHGTTAP